MASIDQLPKAGVLWKRGFAMHASRTKQRSVKNMHRIEILAEGLPLCRVQLAVDTTLVSTLHCDAVVPLMLMGRLHFHTPTH